MSNGIREPYCASLFFPRWIRPSSRRHYNLFCFDAGCRGITIMDRIVSPFQYYLVVVKTFEVKTWYEEERNVELFKDCF